MRFSASYHRPPFLPRENGRRLKCRFTGISEVFDYVLGLERTSEHKKKDIRPTEPQIFRKAVMKEEVNIVQGERA